MKSVIQAIFVSNQNQYKSIINLFFKSKTQYQIKMNFSFPNSSKFY